MTQKNKSAKVLRKAPSYTKWGSSRIAKFFELPLKEVVEFRTTRMFKNIKRNYINSLG